MGEAVDTIPSILNKCLFVSPDRQKDGQTDAIGKTICLPTLAGGDRMISNKKVTAYQIAMPLDLKLELIA